MHGILVQTLRKRLQKAGVDIRAKVRLLSSAQVEVALKAIADDASLRATGHRLDISHSISAAQSAAEIELNQHPLHASCGRSSPPPDTQITTAHHQEKTSLTRQFRKNLAPRIENRGQSCWGP